jgi:hypothetical protein
MPNSSLFRCLILTLPGVAFAAEPLDSLRFGVPASESAHHLVVNGSDVITGGLGEAARRLLPLATPDWRGGDLHFTIRVDPKLPNYLTIRLWGDDVSSDRLLLLCEGKQVGYRHLGDIEILDPGAEEPGYPGRFYERTTPLPEALTAGKTEVTCEIRSSGRMWGYGTNFAQYQKPMTEPTRGIYRVATHTDGFFSAPADERQGVAPVPPAKRETPGPEVLDALKQRVVGEIAGELAAKRPPDQLHIHLLARAYHVAWTPAYHNPQVIARVVAGLDQLHADFVADPGKTRADPRVYNSDWFALGLAGDAVRLLAEPLQSVLDQPLADGGTRRAAWTAMLVDSRDWLRRHRRLYTNQTMIVDLNLYRSHRGVAALDPSQALPEAQALAYLHQAIGLVPWLGSDTDHGPEKPVGDRYFQLTAKGLTRELGFVGYYGEVIDWVTEIYDATRAPGAEGEPRIKAQLAKIAAARAPFRYPLTDADGFRAMRAETVIGWRDDHFPGNVTYGQRPTWDASPFTAAAAITDPYLIGAAQQQLADGQFFSVLAQKVAEKGIRCTNALLGIPDAYATVIAQPPQATRLPMTPGQPDFVFSDEEDGVVALKHGDEILYASLYWRARPAINFLARVHHLTPTTSRIAVVRERIDFTPSGTFFTRPDWTNFGFANGGMRYPDGLHSAHAGEQLPIPQPPPGIELDPGKESVYAGKGDFYVLRYGSYLIAMNCAANKSASLDLPTAERISDLRTGAALTVASVAVPPQTTQVLLVQSLP